MNIIKHKYKKDILDAIKHLELCLIAKSQMVVPNKDKPDRNIYDCRKEGIFYYRVRTKDIKAFWYLGKDLEIARTMRDKLEAFFKSIK